MNKNRAGEFARILSSRLLPSVELLFFVVALGFHTHAMAQSGAPSNSGAHAVANKAFANAPSEQTGVLYSEGKLTINMSNVTLPEVLSRIAAAIGVRIDVPSASDTERMTVVKFGPGNPRDIIASLLSGSAFDYVIQDDEGDPDRIQSVLLLPAGVKDKKPDNGPGPPRPGATYTTARQRTAAVEEASAAASSPATESPSAAPSSTDAVPAPEQNARIPATDALATHPGAMSPPSVLTPESINTQLQQMYQQRAQINQQEHQGAAAPVGPTQ